MFAGLKNYESPSYLVAHPTVYIDLADGTHAYQIFSVYESPSESDSYTIGFAPDEQYETFLQTLKSRSSYDTGVTVTKDDYIITLSTCTKSGEHRNAAPLCFLEGQACLRRAGFPIFGAQTGSIIRSGSIRRRRF